MDSSSVTLFQLLTISCLLLSVSPLTHPRRPFILPIGKDPKTNLFYSQVGIGTPRHDFDLVIDVGGSMLWYDCNTHYNSSTYHPVRCNDAKNCHWDDGAGCNGCNGRFKPGCSNDTCGVNIINPLASFIFSGDKGQDLMFFSHTVVSNLLTGCTDYDGFTGFEHAVLKDLPTFAKGIIGLGRTKLSLPTQLSSSHHLPKKFSLCLPSSNKKGLGSLFIGGEPQFVIPHNHNSSSNFLLTTPLIINPVSTAPISREGDPSYEYFIDVKSIKVNGQALNFKHSLLSINKGIGGTKISTMNPFTVLHHSIYKPLVRDFGIKASDKKIKRVESVAPFGACFDFSTIGRTNNTGLDVPTIDLVLPGGVEWTIHGRNSMVLVNRKVACLGFVNGGKEVTTSLVIGGHQLEDNLLVFDLNSSKLSFSSSLLLHHATCNSNFKI